MDEPLASDRPDFTESSKTVGLGVAQLEFGYTLTTDSAAGATFRQHSFGEFLLRYGIFAEWLELRVGLFPLTEELALAGGPTFSTSGLADLYLGAKIALTPQQGWLPEMALIPQMSVPTGSTAFSSGELQPGLNWIYAWEINETFTTAGSTQFNRSIDGGTGLSFTEFAQSWTLGAGLTDNLGCYIEWFALVPHSATTVPTEHYADGGFTYLINNNIQWDIRLGVGLNENAADLFCGTGLVIRRGP